MADYQAVSEVESRSLEFRRQMAEVRICMFGAVTKVSTSPLRVSVQPLTMMKKTLGKDVSYEALPELQDVPVKLPYAQTLGLMLTLPIAVGDVGVLFVPDSPIDNVLTKQGVSAPPVYGKPEFCTPRSHDLTDAFFVPGLVADYFDIPSYNLDHIELRDKSRKNYISLGEDGITLTDGTAVVKISGGKVTTDAPSGIDNTSQAPITNTTPATMQIDSANFQTGKNGASGESVITGSLRSSDGTFIDKDNKVLGTHTHNYTDDGQAAVTAQPNAG